MSKKGDKSNSTKRCKCCDINFLEDNEKACSECIGRLNKELNLNEYGISVNSNNYFIVQLRQMFDGE